MFFVTVGTAPQPFQRLMEVLMGLPAEIQQEIVFQGAAKNDSILSFSHKMLMSTDEYNQMINDAELVVCHAGIGTVRECYDRGRKTIVIPRLAKYGEHFNNHQLELVEYLLDNPLPNIYPLVDPTRLTEKILEVQNMSEKSRLPGEFGQELKKAVAADVGEMLK